MSLSASPIWLNQIKTYREVAMKNWYLILLVMILYLCTGCKTAADLPDEIKASYPKQVLVSIRNSLDFPVTDMPVLIDLDSLKGVDPEFNQEAWVAFAGGEELAGQVIDRDHNDLADHLLLLASLAAHESKAVYLRYASGGKIARSYTKRTQAELSHKFGGAFVSNDEGRMVYEGGAFKNVSRLRVPPEHTDHTFFIRYEGPGWESDKVGYRFYLDWRNATDIFGKKVTRPVLQNVGQDGFDSYHEMADWGMDILKVGDALGIGAVGYWDGEKVIRVSETDSVICSITADGTIFSEVSTGYHGWQTGKGKTDLTSALSIVAGDRKTRHEVTIDPEPDGLCTGIVKHEGVTVLREMDQTSGWGFLATYGIQSLAGDSLGMALIFRNKDVLEITEDNLNHVIVLKPENGNVNFYFLAAWEQEPGGISSQLHFEQYLEQEIMRLSRPVKVSF